jgi:ribosomal protein L13E
VIVPPAAGAAAGAAETPANAETPAATNLTDRQKTINFEYCNVKNGKIENAKSSSNGITWQNYVSTYKITPEEIAVAKPTCPNVVVPNVGGGQTGPTPTQRLATTAKSLGIQNPKMDVATLQTILNTLNQGGSGLTESKNSVNEELNKMKYILGYQRGRVISEQDAAQTQQAATQPAATPKDLIRQIQTVLKTKYNANLGKFGEKGDGIDEKWGNLTQTALENALKTIADVKQRRETETQQTTTQDTAIQQAAEKGRMEIPQTNNLPNLPGIQQKQDIYTTLVNNKTLVTRPNGNIVYQGVDLTSTQRQELETKLKTMGYNLSTDNRDKTYGDKLIFKKNQ